jgi:hypothetical protein
MSADDFTFDNDLKGRLLAAAPALGDVDTVLETLRPRLRQARRRRRVGVAATSSLACAAVIFGGTLAIARSVRAPEIGTPPVTHSHEATTVPAPSLSPPSSVIPGGASPAGSQPPSTAGRLGGVPRDGGAAAPGAGPAPGAAPPGPTVQTYSSAGGSITIQFADGALSLVSTQPAAGFSESLDDVGPSRVEVRFNNGQTEWRIRVDIVNGQPSPQITND